MHDTTETLLQTSLAVAVPLWIDRIHRESWSADRMQREATRCAQEIGEHGDRILFRSKGTAAAFDALALGAAIAAHSPGGITLFGLHFEVNAAAERGR